MIVKVRQFNAASFIETQVKFHESQKKLAFQSLRNDSQKVKDSYNIILNYYSERERRHINNKCLECGGSLIERVGAFGKFYSCENWTHQSKEHTTKNGFSDNIFKMKSYQWLQDIKSMSNINVSISVLLDFIVNELLLLDIRYFITNEHTSIPNGFSVSGQRAREQEQIFFDKTKDYFDKLTPQVGFEFMTVGSSKFKKRIVDFIGSDSNSVYYVEIKNSYSDFKVNQFSESFEMIRFYMENVLKDKRALFGSVYTFEDKPFELDENIKINLATHSINKREAYNV